MSAARHERAAPRPSTSRRCAAGLPHPAPAGPRQAAGLPGQRRHQPEAAGRHRRHRPLLPARTTPTSTAACTSSPSGPPTDYEDAREKVRALPQRRRTRRRSSSCAAPPRPSTWSRRRYGRKRVGAGDEILITALEHHSNIVPWQMLCEEKGATLRVVPIDDDGELLLDELRAAARRRARGWSPWRTSPTRWARSTRSAGSSRWRTPRASRCCSTARRRCRTSPSTCRRWTATSTPSPATSCSAPPASACSTARRSCWRPMPP